MAKENLIRKKAIQILEGENWVVWFAPKVKYCQTDVFGIFDLVCWQKRTAKIKFIQLTTLPNLSTRQKKINNFLKKNKLSKQSLADIEIWGWNKRNKIFKVVKI